MGIGLQKEIDTNAQSQTSPVFQYFMMRELKTDIILTAPVAADDETVDVSPSHGFVIGDHIVIQLGDAFEQIKVVNVVADRLTVEMPIANAFPIDGTRVIRGNINLNVDGSITPVDFLYRNYDTANSTIPIDINLVIVTMQHGSNVPDDGHFGGLVELTNGLYFRKENLSRMNLGNYTTNQSFRDRGASVSYSAKAPAGTNGTVITFELNKIFEQVIRIDPRITEYLRGQIRDNLSAAAGMEKLTVSITGGFTNGE